MNNQHILASVAAVALCSIGFVASAQSLPTIYNPGITLSRLSDNAKYAIGSTAGDDNVDNPVSAGGTFIDLTTKTQTKIDAPGGWAEVADVADNGIVVGSSQGRPGYWDPTTRAWTTFSVPREWGGGAFTAVTPDANYAVGYYFDAANIYNVAPMMYDLTTGQAVEVSNLPKHDLTGVDRKQNVFFGISPDARYVLGEMSMSYLSDLDPTTGEMRPALFSYVYDREQGTWSAIGYDYDEATGKYSAKTPNLHMVNNQFMSCDGLWVTGSAYMVMAGGEMYGGTEAFYPYRYEVATGNFEVYTSDADANVAGNKITADGTVLASSPMGNPYPTAQIRYGKYFISLDQIIQQVYGTSVQDLIHDPVTGSFESISADGLTALMVTYDNSYIITMPEPFADLAAKVDLLSNYEVSIPDGATINRVSEIEITFEREIACSGQPSKVRLLDAQGNTVRSASGFGISVTNSHTVVVTFRSTNLTPGEHYTVDIPAESIWLKDDPTVKSRNIQIHYTGRTNGPIQVRRISPANGAAVAQLNSNPDYIAVTFDTPVAISETGKCTLYNADDGTYITDLFAGAVGQQAIFFPLSTYELYKGSNYKVVIEAGSVTDLSGGGGNEEIVINYTGAYVRELSGDDIYIFNSPCDSYDNFMFWQGENNQPAAIPRGWGFEAENPWILVRDNNESTDMALAAHSMFVPAGESDDWLITPQLFIPDARTYLAFDAQSYLRSRDDVLKVYVYTDNAVYNYFNADLAERFRTAGDLVFDEVISAGDSDEKLDGEWTHYTVPLDKYAGKNIYIAFVNNNYDKSAIFIDDIKVVRDLSFLLTNQTPTTVVNKESVTVTGLLTSGSEINDYEGIYLRLLDADGTLIDEISDPDHKLVYGDPYKYTFAKALQLTPGQMTEYQIEVNAGNESSSYVFTVKDLVFEPVKRVVLEEFSGASCANCPLGIQAVDNLLKLYPDNFIPVVHRTFMNDIYASGVTDYSSFLGFNAAPSGRINRGPIIAPMLQNGAEGYTFFGRGITTSDGSEAYLWADAVQDELNVPAEAEVTAQASYNTETGEITVPCTVRFALDRNDMSVGVFAVVLENNLPTYQYNNFAAISDPNLGPWGLGGMYAQQTVTSWLAQEVVRFVVNGVAFNGTSMHVSDFVAGVDYDITLNATIPANRLYNPDNCSVVTMLIDRSTGMIINAYQTQMKLGSIADVVIDADSQPEYYDLQGIKVENPQPGRIYIRVIGGKAQKVKI